jgi:hypothetical protein
MANQNLFPPKFISGTYMRSDGSVYDYKVQVDPTIGNAVWLASVVRDGAGRGNPSGIAGVRFTSRDLEDNVRAQVEACIRDGLNVRID